MYINLLMSFLREKATQVSSFIYERLKEMFPCIPQVIVCHDASVFVTPVPVFSIGQDV